MSISKISVKLVEIFIHVSYNQNLMPIPFEKHRGIKLKHPSVIVSLGFMGGFVLLVLFCICGRFSGFLFWGLLYTSY